MKSIKRFLGVILLAGAVSVSQPVQSVSLADGWQGLSTKGKVRIVKSLGNSSKCLFGCPRASKCLKTTAFASTSSSEPTSFSSNDKAVFWAVIAASVVGYLGFKYYQSNYKPFNLYKKAKESYNATDAKLLNLLERYATDNSDVSELASAVYLKPSRSLVDLMLSLEAVQRNLKSAALEIEQALTLLKEESFETDCTYLKNMIQSRLTSIEALITLVHEHPLWEAQSSIYAQEESARISTGFSLRGMKSNDHHCPYCFGPYYNYGFCHHCHCKGYMWGQSSTLGSSQSKKEATQSITHNPEAREQYAIYHDFWN